MLGVPTTKGEESRFVPVAMHCAPLEQSIASRLAPVGIELVGTQVEKSVVLKVVAFPSDLIPTATQVVPVEQDNEIRALTLGVDRTAQG